MTRLLSIERVAEHLDVSQKTVRALAGSGKLLGVKVGRQWKFKPADVERYIERQTQRLVDAIASSPKKVRSARRRRGVLPPGVAELQLPGADIFLRGGNPWS